MSSQTKVSIKAYGCSVVYNRRAGVDMVQGMDHIGKELDAQIIRMKGFLGYDDVFFMRNYFFISPYYRDKAWEKLRGSSAVMKAHKLDEPVECELMDPV